MVAILLLSSSLSLFYFDPCRTLPTQHVIYLIFFFSHEVLPAIMLVWKFLKVVTSVLLLGQEVIPQTLL